MTVAFFLDVIYAAAIVFLAAAAVLLAWRAHSVWRRAVATLLWLAAAGLGYTFWSRVSLPRIDVAGAAQEATAGAAPALAPASAPAPSPAPAPAVAADAEKPQTAPPARKVSKRRAAAVPPAASTPAPPSAQPEGERQPLPATPPPVLLTPPPVPAPPPRAILPANTTVVVHLARPLSTERSRKGDTFVATLDEALVADGYVIADKGAKVEGVVERSQRAGRFRGGSELAIALVRLEASDGQKLAISTDSYEVERERSQGVLGAIVAGGASLVTRGKDAAIPAEARLGFTLRRPLEVWRRP